MIDDRKPAAVQETFVQRDHSAVSQVLDDGRKQFFPGMNPTSPHRMSVFTQYSDCENESQYFPSGSPSSYNNISDNISTGINTTICQHVHNIDEQFREFAETVPILQSFPNKAVIDIMMRYSDFIQHKNQKCDGIHQNQENSHENHPSNSNSLHEVPANILQGDTIESKYNYTQSHVNQQNSPSITPRNNVIHHNTNVQQATNLNSSSNQQVQNNIRYSSNQQNNNLQQINHSQQNYHQQPHYNQSSSSSIPPNSTTNMFNSNPFFIALSNKTKMANLDYQLKDTAL